MPETTERRILRLLDHIHDHPAGDLSLDALADATAPSRFHWHRVVRAMTGRDGGPGGAALPAAQGIGGAGAGSAAGGRRGAGGGL